MAAHDVPGSTIGAPQGVQGVSGFAIWDKDGNLTAWSRPCLDFWYEPTAIIQHGMPMIDLLRHIAEKGGFGEGDPGELAERELARITKAGPASEDEFRLLDGRLIHVTRHPMADGGHTSVYTDVTSRDAADEALRQSENLHQALLSGVQVGVFRSDLDGNITYVNEKWCEISGLAHEKALGGGWIESIHPGDRDSVREAWQEFASGGALYKREQRYQRPDNSVSYCYVQVAKECLDSGDVVGFIGTVTDITEQITQRNSLKAIFDNSPAELYLKDAEGRYLQINRQFEKLFNVKNEDLVGRLPGDAHYPGLVDTTRKQDLEVLETGKPVIREEHAVTELGPRVLHTIKFPVFDDQQNVTGLGAVVTDITDLKTSEAELLKHQQQLATAAKLAKLGFWEWDERLDRSMSFSQGFVDILDLKPEALRGGRISGDNNRDVVHPDDAEQYYEVSRFSDGDEDQYDVEYRSVRSDGTITYCREIGKAVRDEAGNIVRSFGIVQDITDRKLAEEKLLQSEHRLKEAQRIARIGDWERDLETDELLWSDEVFQLFQMDRDEFDNSIAGFFQRVHPEDKDNVTQAVQGVIDGTGPRVFDYRIVLPGGEVRYLQEISEVDRDRFGTAVYLRGTVQDITERKRAEKALQSALLEAEKANRIKSQFLATMSHEFRTPLNAILGFSEMLQGQYFGPLGSKNYETYAKDIHDSSQHMLALINDVLDISTIEAGKRALNKEDVDVHEVLEECIKNVEQSALDGGLELSCDIPDDLPVLQADRRSVVQVILNLLSNAIKFTKAGGSIVLSASLSDSGIVLRVTDTGVGISADRLPVVTEPFSQSHDDPHLAQLGTGLGLSIVKSLTEAHGGTLEIESELGKGTVATVTLPHNIDRGSQV